MIPGDLGDSAHRYSAEYDEQRRRMDVLWKHYLANEVRDRPATDAAVLSLAQRVSHLEDLRPRVRALEEQTQAISREVLRLGALVERLGARELPDVLEKCAALEEARLQLGDMHESVANHARVLEAQVGRISELARDVNGAREAVDTLGEHWTLTRDLAQRTAQQLEPVPAHLQQHTETLRRFGADLHELLSMRTLLVQLHSDVASLRSTGVIPAMSQTREPQWRGEMGPAAALGAPPVLSPPKASVNLFETPAKPEARPGDGVSWTSGAQGRSETRESFEPPARSASPGAERNAFFSNEVEENEAPVLKPAEGFAGKHTELLRRVDTQGFKEFKQQDRDERNVARGSVASVATSGGISMRMSKVRMDAPEPAELWVKKCDRDSIAHTFNIFTNFWVVLTGVTDRNEVKLEFYSKPRGSRVAFFDFSQIGQGQFGVVDVGGDGKKLEILTPGNFRDCLLVEGQGQGGDTTFADFHTKLKAHIQWGQYMYKKGIPGLAMPEGGGGESSDDTDPSDE